MFLEQYTYFANLTVWNIILRNTQLSNTVKKVGKIKFWINCRTPEIPYSSKKKNSLWEKIIKINISRSVYSETVCYIPVRK